MKFEVFQKNSRQRTTTQSEKGEEIAEECRNCDCSCRIHLGYVHHAETRTAQQSISDICDSDHGNMGYLVAESSVSSRLRDLQMVGIRFSDGDRPADRSSVRASKREYASSPLSNDAD